MRSTAQGGPQQYEYVQIGTQKWMTRNLDVVRYRNGDSIPNIIDNTDWSNLNTGAYSNYDNSLLNGAFYGKLYNWYTLDDPRGLAPVGWHIPTDDEWTTLANYLGGDLVGGGKMKVEGTTIWAAPNTGADNTSGFTALPAGNRAPNGPYNYIGNYTYWWSSIQQTITTARIRIVNFASAGVPSATDAKNSGLSVRCIKD